MNDKDRLAFERRAFLRGFMVTSAGLLVPRKVIRMPVEFPGASWSIAMDGQIWTAAMISMQFRLAS